MRKIGFVLTAGTLFIIFLCTTSGGFLIVNHPRKSDVIVTLAGETDRRPTEAVELLVQGYASRMVLDAPAETKIYGVSQVELAQKYVEQLPQANAISVCPVYGRSTRDEAHDVARCLQGSGAQSILLVTSDYHTRRALSIFRRVSPGTYSVAAAFDDREFGSPWWRHRQWAKVNFEEWCKLMWWELFERWRN